MGRNKGKGIEKRISERKKKIYAYRHRKIENGGKLEKKRKIYFTPTSIISFKKQSNSE